MEGRLVGPHGTGAAEEPPSTGTRTDIEKTSPAFVEQDNWKHRSDKMRCGCCMFFMFKSTSVIQQMDHMIGRCRALAPTMKGWPVVFSDDWCGNHKLDEEKI